MPQRFRQRAAGQLPPEDHVIRYAGDEFVVVAPGLEPRAARHARRRLRDRLKLDRGGPPIGFSVGTAELAVNGETRGGDPRRRPGHVPRQGEQNPETAGGVNVRRRGGVEHLR